MEVVNEINVMRQVLHKHKNMKKCYFCGSGMHMLNNGDIRDTIERYHWFDRKGNVHSNHQQISDKDDEKKWKVMHM